MVTVYHGDWSLVLSDECDYVDMNRLSTTHGVLVYKWLTNSETGVLLEHLEHVGLQPCINDDDGKSFLRVELLPLILGDPRFATGSTPQVPDNLFRLLIDNKLREAPWRMGTHHSYIDTKDTESEAERKVDAAREAFDNVVVEKAKRENSRLALTYEKAIRGVHYRMLLAMLMTYSSHHRR